MSCALGHAVLDHVGELLGAASKSLFRTVLGTLALGIALIVITIWWAADGSVLRGLLAGLVVAVLCTVVGLFLAGQRALGAAMQLGIRRLRLGERTVRLVFERVLGATADFPDQRGAAAARVAENLPLAKAEGRLNDAVQSILKTPGQGGGLGGWLLRKLQGRLLGYVRFLTLTRFRQGAAGGIDLGHLRDDLAANIDNVIARQVAARLAFATRLAIFLMIALSLLAAFLIRQIPL